MKKGFTLIELLVVVLIIGILSSVALPQYRKAVAKSRYATLKNLVESINQAEQTYYMANGVYTINFDELDIDIGTPTSDSSHRNLSKGYCYMYQDTASVYIVCENTPLNMAYEIAFNFSGNDWARYCQTYNNNTTAQQICQQETNNATPSVNSRGNGNIWYRYP